MNDRAHWRTAVPNAFQSMTSCSNDDRCFLATRSAIAHRRCIIAQNLQRIIQVIQILNLCDGSESPQRESDSLPSNGALPNPCVRYPQLTKLLLHALHGLIHPSNSTCIFSKRDQFRVFLEKSLKILLQNLPAIRVVSAIRIFRTNNRHIQSRIPIFAVQMPAIAILVFTAISFRPADQCLKGGGSFSSRALYRSPSSCMKFGPTGKNAIFQGCYFGGI